MSRGRVASALTAAGVDRRGPGRACPIGCEELRRLHADGVSQNQLAARLGAAPDTVNRWLAECGIGEPDPRIPRSKLQSLYLDRRLTTREVAAELGVPHHRVVRELALAGIQARSRHDRRPRGARLALTDEALQEWYVRRGLSIKEMCAFFGVSDEYLRKRLRECGYVKRPGSFTPKLDRSRDDITADAAELYGEASLHIREVAKELGVSTTLVREVLHEAGTTVSPPGVRRSEATRERRVLKDLHADPAIAEVLNRFGVVFEDPSRWTRPGQWEVRVPLPLPTDLLEDLYLRLGLSAFHISLVCGVGTLAILNGLHRAGIEVRPPSQPCPWTTRTYG